MGGGSPYIDISLIIGGDGIKDQNKPSSPSVRVKPNTTYEFGFDMGGTATALIMTSGSMRFFFVRDDNKNRKKIMPTFKPPKSIDGKPGWARYTGEFTTFEDTYSCTMKLLFWGSGSKYSPGSNCYILLDNIFIKEKK